MAESPSDNKEEKVDAQTEKDSVNAIEGQAVAADTNTAPAGEVS